MSDLDRLVRPDLRGRTAYGAPQLDVAVPLNVNENSYGVPADVVEDMVNAAVAKVQAEGKKKTLGAEDL